MSLLYEGLKQFLKLFKPLSASEESTICHIINTASMLENLSMHSPRDRLTGISLTFHFFPQHASLISAPVAWEFKAKSEVPLPESPFLYLSYFPDCHASVASLPLISKKKKKNPLGTFFCAITSSDTLRSHCPGKSRNTRGGGRAAPLLSISNCI